MGKHIRLVAPARSSDEKQELHEQAEALLRRTIGHLGKLLGAVEATLEAGEANPALARESAGVARAMTGLAAELRQREKHVRDMVARMSAAEQTALVLEYLRELQTERRAEVRAFLDELDQEESVLG